MNMIKLCVLLLLSIFPSTAAQLRPEFNVGVYHKLVEGRHGTFLINKHDSWIGRSLDVYGEWEDSSLSLMSEFIDEGSVVADIGANIGAFSVPLARVVGPGGKVVAFEPQRILSQLLSANLMLNELSNVGVYNSGVGDSEQPLEVPDVLYNSEANFGAVSLVDVDWKAKGASTTLVPQVKLDDVFASQCPALIKVDVEGMELLVLSGALQTLERCNPVLYVENNCKRGSKDTINFLTRLGYICHWHVHPYFSKDNFRRHASNIFPANANSINMLCYSKHDQKSAQKSELLLPSITRIDVPSGRFQLHEYNLSYTGRDGFVLSQMGTNEACER